MLLESSEYRASQNACSILAAQPLDTLVIDDPKAPHVERLREFIGAYVPEHSVPGNGIFGFTTFDAVQGFEDITFREKPAQIDMPALQYSLFRFVIIFDPFHNRLTLIENSLEPFRDETSLDDLERFLFSAPAPQYRFRLEGAEDSVMNHEQHIGYINAMKRHIQRGDIFQGVPARRFTQRFRGDDFAFYRALRSLNPSPYLFYFDLGRFRLIGSSPESQVIVSDGAATVHPIAGTYPRRDNDAEDARAAMELAEDPKENAEHVMLVDLARNDLSRGCHPVMVEKFKEVQFYSHLIHLVSVVKGRLSPGSDAFSIFRDTFPAGTVSGAPKYRAMELIDAHEPVRRQFYSGAVGYYGFNGDAVHALALRTVLSKDDTIYYQGGGGVVADSSPERELAEVRSKLGAIRQAMILATELEAA